MGARPATPPAALHTCQRTRSPAPAPRPPSPAALRCALTVAPCSRMAAVAGRRRGLQSACAGQAHALADWPARWRAVPPPAPGQPALVPSCLPCPARAGGQSAFEGAGDGRRHARASGPGAPRGGDAGGGVGGGCTVCQAPLHQGPVCPLNPCCPNVAPRQGPLLLREREPPWPQWPRRDGGAPGRPGLPGSGRGGGGVQPAQPPCRRRSAAAAAAAFVPVRPRLGVHRARRPSGGSGSSQRLCARAV